MAWPRRNDPWFVAAVVAGGLVGLIGLLWSIHDEGRLLPSAVSAAGWFLLGEALWVRRQGGNVTNTVRARLRMRRG